MALSPNTTQLVGLLRSASKKNGQLETQTVPADAARRRKEAKLAANATKEYTHKAQDFHTIMQEMLRFYKNVKESGFKWDLVIGEHVHRDVEFVPYIAFIKCDTKEADLNCGSFGSRGENVSQLCRKCCCPTKESDNPEADYPLKTQEMMKDLVALKNTDGL